METSFQIGSFKGASTGTTAVFLFLCPWSFVKYQKISQKVTASPNQQNFIFHKNPTSQYDVCDWSLTSVDLPYALAAGTFADGEPAARGGGDGCHGQKPMVVRLCHTVTENDGLWMFIGIEHDSTLWLREEFNNLSNWSTRGCWELLRSFVDMSRRGRLDDAGGMKVRCTRRRAGRTDAWPLPFFF